MSGTAIARTVSLVLAIASVAGAAGSQSALPRTADGHPDLQGTWLNDTMTPLARPPRFAGQAFFSPEEAAEFEKNFDNVENNAARLGAVDERVSADLNPAWTDRGKLLPDHRTSLIVDPPTGRIPRTPGAQRQFAERAALRDHPEERLPEGPEDLPVSDRCLVFGAGPPLIPAPYNKNVQIVQTADAVMVLTEMIHDARIIPLDGRPRLPAHIRQWLGDGRGRWEGDVLVVETTNFTAKTQLAGSSDRLRVIERFSLVDAATLRYEFTLDDPATYTQPWSGALQMTRTEHRIYEYACHEGNYSMVGMLRGARAADKKP